MVRASNAAVLKTFEMLFRDCARYAGSLPLQLVYGASIKRMRSETQLKLPAAKKPRQIGRSR